MNLRHHYHVVTPFSRFQHLHALASMLGAVAKESDRLTWNIIFDEDPPFEVAAPWIRAYYAPASVDGWFMGHYKQNWFAEHAVIHKEHRYLLLNDDDAYGTDFFQKVDAVDGQVLIVSMRRNSQGDLLVAQPSNLASCLIGGEQIIVTGQILALYRWGKEYTGDWDFIKAVTTDHKPVFVPEAEVWWNYYQPGRWS